MIRGVDEAGVERSGPGSRSGSPPSSTRTGHPSGSRPDRPGPRRDGDKSLLARADAAMYRNKRSGRALISERLLTPSLCDAGPLRVQRTGERAPSRRTGVDDRPERPCASGLTPVRRVDGVGRTRRGKEPGEDDAATLRRELTEETGVPQVFMGPGLDPAHDRSDGGVRQPGGERLSGAVPPVRDRPDHDRRRAREKASSSIGRWPSSRRPTTCSVRPPCPGSSPRSSNTAPRQNPSSSSTEVNIGIVPPAAQAQGGSERRCVGGSPSRLVYRWTPTQQGDVAMTTTEGSETTVLGACPHDCPDTCSMVSPSRMTGSPRCGATRSIRSPRAVSA